MMSREIFKSHLNLLPSEKIITKQSNLMKKDQTQYCQTELQWLADRLNDLWGFEKPSKKKPLIDQFSQRIKAVGKILPMRDTKIFQEQQILKVYEDISFEFKEFLVDFEHKIRRKDKELQESPGNSHGEEIKFQEEDPEKIRKEHELMTLKEMNKLMDEQQLLQDMINKRLLEDSESIDQIYEDSSKSVDHSKKATEELSQTSKKERASRLRWFQVGTTGVGALFGHIWGGIAGFFVSNRISASIQKSYDKKIDKMKRADC